MSEEEKEEIIKYAKIFSNAKGDTHKINFVNENKTIDEAEVWKGCLFLIDRLQKELEEKTTILMVGADKVKQLEKENVELKEKIREFIKKELPDDEIMECCSNYDVNGVAIRKELEKILEDKE